jgi:hypothetical protein
MMSKSAFHFSGARQALFRIAKEFTAVPRRADF